MTTTPPEAPFDPAPDEGASTGPGSPGSPGTGPRVSHQEMRDLGRLRRSAYDRKVAGVAGGLARHLDIDPLVMRVVFVVLAFFGGAGVILYGACWLIVPDEATEDATVRLDDRSRSVALLIVGAIAALALLGDSLGGWGFPWPLAIIGVVVLVVMSSRRQSGVAAPPRPSGPPVPPGHSGHSGHSEPSAYNTAIAPQAYSYPYPQPVAPRRNPRRRGPVLFWFTAALAALGVGVVGILDLAGLDIPGSAYPATVLGATGVMLLVGAFYGRAGGLIALGLVAALATAVATASDEFDAGQVLAYPESASAVESSYELTAGEILLDLTDIGDLDALNGRTIDVRATFGRIEVIVPRGIDVDVDATVEAVGHTALFGSDTDASDSAYLDGGEDAPVLYLDLEVTFGEIEVTTIGRNRR